MSKFIEVTTYPTRVQMLVNVDNIVQVYRGAGSTILLATYGGRFDYWHVIEDYNDVKKFLTQKQ